MALKRIYNDLEVKGIITSDGLQIAGAFSFPTVDGTANQVLTTDGSGNVTWQSVAALSLTTDDIIEGLNLYFTQERAEDTVGALIGNGTGLNWTYNDIANTLVGNVTLSPFDTGDLAEGVNLYFTNERVDDRVSNLIQNGTGISWVYNDIANTLTPTISLSPFDTDDLSEGATNKYATNERIDDRVAVLIQNGTGISWVYNDPANTLTPTISLSPFTTDNLAQGATNKYATNEVIDDRVAALMVNSSTVTWSYNDALNQLSAAAITQLNVQKISTLVGTRPTLNFIPGAGATINVADDGVFNRINITIGAAALSKVQSDGVQVGDSDIQTLNFEPIFTVTESIDTLITIGFDFANSDFLNALDLRFDLNFATKNLYELADVDFSASPGLLPGDILQWTGTVWTAATPSPGTFDERVKVSASDTSESYLIDKIIGTINKIDVTQMNIGGDEYLQLTVGSDIFDKAVDSSDDITEGTTNLFYSDIKVVNLIQNGIGLTWNYASPGVLIGDVSLSSFTIDELSDVDTSTDPPNIGEALIWDGTNWVPQPVATSKRTWVWSGAVNATVNTSQYLRVADGVVSSNNSYIAAFNSKLTAISASSQNSATWTAQVRVNGVSVATVVITAATQGYVDGLSININAGDSVEFYASVTTSTQRPIISGWFENQ